MVVLIISIIAAIAVPRVSSAHRNAEGNAILATLANVRAAIDLYYAEHGRYPGYDPASGNPDDQAFIDQLTLFSDAAGNVSATPKGEFIFGPYLRRPFPTNPLNGLATVKVHKDAPDVSALTGKTGWIAGLAEGSFDINAQSTELERARLSGEAFFSGTLREGVSGAKKGG